MTNYERYLHDISESVSLYKVNIQDFTMYLFHSMSINAFIDDLHMICDDTKTLYDVALDYSIPVIMVKWFLAHTVSWRTYLIDV